MRLRSLVVFLGAASILCLALKLFTTEIRHSDDPSIALAIRSTPALTNRMVLPEGARFSDYTVLLADENAYLGMSLYALTTAWLWWLLPALALVVVVVARRNDPSGR
jgi:hypothetical protein